MSIKDSWWKDCIRRFLPELILKMIPELYYDVDFTKKPNFLSQELQDTLQIPNEHNSARFVDELIEIQLKTGDTQWVLLHIEVQGKGNYDISWRMMLYCCLIFAHYHKMPVALAILTDKRPKKETPGIFEFNQYGTKHTYVYNLFEIYKQDDAELLNSNNPFDIIIYAAKKYNDYNGRGKKKELKKFSYLKEITQLLFNKGWKRDDIRALLILTERIIRLKDKELRLQYRTETEKMEGKNKMALSFIEEWLLEEREKGRSDGISQGILQGISQGISQGRNEEFERAVEFMTSHGIKPEIISQFKNSKL